MRDHLRVCLLPEHPVEPAIARIGAGDRGQGFGEVMPRQVGKAHRHDEARGKIGLPPVADGGQSGKGAVGRSGNGFVQKIEFGPGGLRQKRGGQGAKRGGAGNETAAGQGHGASSGDRSDRKMRPWPITCTKRLGDQPAGRGQGLGEWNGPCPPGDGLSRLRVLRPTCA